MSGHSLTHSLTRQASAQLYVGWHVAPHRQQRIPRPDAGIALDSCHQQISSAVAVQLVQLTERCPGSQWPFSHHCQLRPLAAPSRKVSASFSSSTRGASILRQPALLLQASSCCLAGAGRPSSRSLAAGQKHLSAALLTSSSAAGPPGPATAAQAAAPAPAAAGGSASAAALSQGCCTRATARRSSPSSRPGLAARTARWLGAAPSARPHSMCSARVAAGTAG